LGHRATGPQGHRATEAQRREEKRREEKRREEKTEKK
jgi:hypothetical protein